MTSPYVLSIDQGTTGTTALAVDAAGRVRGRGYREIAQHYPAPGQVEHDPEEIVQASLEAVAQSLGRAGIRAADLAAIGIANQRETTLLWERAGGRPIGRAIVWQDRRTAPLCDALRAAGLETLVRERTGLVLDPYFSATKIRWLLDRDPALRARAQRGEIAFGTMDSWLLYRLTGGAVHATDCSNASRTLLFDIRRLAWDGDLLAGFDIPAAVLPRVGPSSGIVGHTTAAFFDTPGVPIAGIAGDQQAALFGQACHGPGMAKNTYGTGSFVLMHTGDRPVASAHGLLSTVAWQIGREPAEYALEGSIFVTGAAVQWLRDGLGLIRDARETEALAAGLADNRGLYFVPALTGLGAPHWDPYARGLLIGIDRGTTGAHLARAVLESMAYQTCDAIAAMERDSGIPVRQLRCDGGAAVNAWLMQFQADLLGVTVEVPEVVETTALGAAYLAGLAIGLWPDRAAIAARWALADRYSPRMDAPTRERLRRRWTRAVGLAKGWAREDPGP